MRYFILNYLSLFFTNHAFSQEIIFVNQNAVGANNGTDWMNAFTDLQDALAVASANDEIWVSTGTYKPTPANNILVSFNLISGVKIYGGFSGTESSLEERDWENNITVLSGDLGQPDYAVDNSKHVITGIGITNAVLDGFKICDGAAYDPEGSGGAIYLTLNLENLISRIVIANCIFENNFAYRGGALAINPFLNNSSEGRIIPELHNCVFKNNIAAFGGGAVNMAVRTIPGEVSLIANCRFENNTIGEPLGGQLLPASAGAINIASLGGYNAAVFFDHCSFTSNTATNYGGAIRFENNSEIDTLLLHLRGCDFKNNTAVRGSALYIGSTLTSSTKQTIYNFTDCIFEKNNETDEEYPSVNMLLYNEGHLPDSKCSLVINHTTIAHNNCSDCVQLEVIAGSSDLDISIKNSVFSDNNSQVFSLKNSSNQSDVNYFHFEMANSVFTKNLGCVGLSGGIFNDSQVKGRIINSTFANNSGYIISKAHTLVDAAFPRHDTMVIENCIIWNPEVSPSRTFYNTPVFMGEVNNLYGYSISHSLIALDTTEAFQLPGHEYAFGSGIIFNQSPEFIDTLNGNYRIEVCSPAVNAGNNIVAFGLLLDIDSLPRIALDTIDMGAYEQQDSCKTNVASSPNLLLLLLAPNPSFDGQLFIDMQSITGNFGVLRIADMTGYILIEQKVDLTLNYFADLHHVSPGAYVVQLDTDNKHFIGKWLKLSQ
jgi:predicted outer membrane repeat protein